MYICIQIRLPGRNAHLYFGRGHGHEGFWLGEKQIDSFLRKRDRFLEYLRKYLSGSVLLGIELDSLDRVINIKYRRFGKVSNLMLFYCGRNLFFSNIYLNEKKKYLEQFSSWRGVHDYEEKSYFFEQFDEVGRKNIDDKEAVSKKTPISKLLKLELEKAYKTATSGKSLKFLKRKKKNILNDLNKVEQISILDDLVKMDDLSTFPKKNKFQDIKLNFKFNDHYKRRDEVYTKIKKLKKAKEILTLRLEDTEKSLSLVDEAKALDNHLKIIEPVWRMQKKETIKTKVGEGYKVFDIGIIALGVGITSSGNDALRKEWASKQDIWFHLDGDKSPHVILKLRESLLDSQIFEIVAACMKNFGKIESNEVTLVYTQVKNLKGVKGAAGKVNFKKEKRIKTYVENNFNYYINS